MDGQNANLIATASEFIPNRLYLVVFKTELMPLNTNAIHYFSIDDELVYESFFNDFGPLNICMLFRYTQKLNRKLSTNLHLKKRIVHYTTIDAAKRLNSAFLIGAYAIIYLNKTPQQAFEPLNFGPPYAQFCDASYGTSNYTISLMDCLQAVYKARNAGFFDFNDFDAVEYEYYERVEYGDLNWIIPNKFVAFCGPHNRSKIDNGYPCHAPETYFNYFRQNNVSTIIRLNLKLYNAARFLNAGFDHKELFFTDGSKPSDPIMKNFLQICESAGGAIAVHCKAGLGRTGSLIGAYMMKHYRFTALEAIAWLRLCRPGSVIGHQQQWMEEKQNQLWMDGLEFYKGTPSNKAAPSEFGIYSIKQRELAKTAQASLLAPATSATTSATAVKNATTAYDDIIMKNTNNVQTLKLKDRVRNISQKVDSIKLNDGKITPFASRKCAQRDENKNSTLSALSTPVSATTTMVAATTGTSTTAPTTTGKKYTYPSISNNNNNNNNNNNHNNNNNNNDDEVDSNEMCNNKLEKNGVQTQGDTLNQIKAMRRQRQQQILKAMRLEAKSSSTAIQNKDESQTTNMHQYHTRPRSQPFRTRSSTAAAAAASSATATVNSTTTTTATGKPTSLAPGHLKPIAFTVQNRSDNYMTYPTVGGSTSKSQKDDINRIRSMSVQQRSSGASQYITCFNNKSSSTSISSSPTTTTTTTTSHIHSLTASHNQRNRIYLRNHVSRSRSKTVTGAEETKSNNHRSQSTIIDEDVLNGNVGIFGGLHDDPREKLRRSSMRNYTRAAILNDIACGTPTANGIECDNGNIKVKSRMGDRDGISGTSTAMVPSAKRNKRTLSSTHIEREKSDGKNIKLLRKNAAALRTLSPLMVGANQASTSIGASNQINNNNKQFACDDRIIGMTNKRSQSICTSSSVAVPRKSNAIDTKSGGMNSNNNNNISTNSYVALRLRKR